MPSNRFPDRSGRTGILLVRSMPLQRDSRSSKMAAAYAHRGHRVVPMIWSRGEPVSTDGEAIVCTAKSGYGRRLGGIAARLRWMAFMIRQMVIRRRDYDVVHSVDLDTSIVTLPLAILLGKRVVYDAFDSIGAILGHGPVGRVLARIERAFVASATIAIFPDPIRLKQYGVVDRRNVTIIGNIPDAIDDTLRRGNATEMTAPPGPLRCVYIGTLEAQHRGLEYIPAICAAQPNRVEFVVGGTGQLADFFAEKDRTVPNLRYIGHLDYATALTLMTSADALYGPYLLTAEAHRYASPNKIYEHLMLGKPLVTSSGTPPARLVEEANSGFVFDGSVDGVLRLFGSLDREACRAAGRRARACWEERFASLRQTQLDAFFAKLEAASKLRGGVRRG